VVASDVATIQAQLQKPAPDVGVIQKMWTSIERVVTVGEFATLVAAAAEIVHRLAT
jgi:hypothetical protein